MRKALAVTLDVVLRVLGLVVGVGMIAALANKTIESEGYTGADAWLVIAGASLVVGIALFIGNAWRRGRYVIAVGFVIALIVGDGYQFG